MILESKAKPIKNKSSIWLLITYTYDTTDMLFEVCYSHAISQIVLKYIP